MEYKDYYEMMGVARDAAQDEIKRAYRKLARKYHPDVSKEVDAEARFKELGEAYEVLKDPEKRAAYGPLGAQWKAGREFHPPPDWDAGFEFSGGGHTAAGAEEHSAFFEELFGRGYARPSGAGGRRTFRMRGEDHHAKVLIDLEGSFTGARRSISLRVPELTDEGHVTTRDHTLSVRIPKGILEPTARPSRHWRFPASSLRRTRITLHLQRDLAVNLAGAALAPDLLERIEALEARLCVMRGGRG